MPTKPRFRVGDRVKTTYEHTAVGDASGSVADCFIEVVGKQAVWVKFDTGAALFMYLTDLDFADPFVKFVRDTLEENENATGQGPSRKA